MKIWNPVRAVVLWDISPQSPLWYFRWVAQSSLRCKQLVGLRPFHNLLMNFCRAAAEMVNPRRNIATAMRTVFFRIVFFYVGFAMPSHRALD